MEFLASLFVAKPQNILGVAALFLVGYLALRLTPLGGGRHPGWIFMAAIAWVVYAAWEWLILIRTPEANIRIDLLVLWPALAILSAWALFRTFRQGGGTGG